MRHSAMIVSTFVLAMLPSAASASSLAALANGPDSLQQANKALTSLNAGISGSWYDPSKDQQGFSRFAAQWNYLVSLYNQIMKAAVESPPGGISSESVLRLWRAGFSVTSVIAQLPIGKGNRCAHQTMRQARHARTCHFQTDHLQSHAGSHGVGESEEGTMPKLTVRSSKSAAVTITREAIKSEKLVYIAVANRPLRYRVVSAAPGFKLSAGQLDLELGGHLLVSV